MNVSDFLDHAEALANEGSPAACRSAVSRAYYAAHHATVHFLFAVGVRTPGGGARHLAAFNALAGIDAATDQPVRRAGSELMTLHGKRTRADYDWQDLSLEDQNEAQELVVSAREIVNALEECLAEEERVDDIYLYFRTWVPRNGQRLGLTLV